MKQDRNFERIHREIDGENTAAESALLREQLAADPGARRICEDLRGLCASLEAMPLSEPPAGLATSILAAIRQNRAEAAFPGEWRSRRPAAWGLLKYTYALAAGLLLGILLTPPLLDRIRSLNTPEDSDLIGTMARSGQSPSPKWNQVIDFGPDTSRGMVRLHQSGRLTLVELELRTGTAEEVSLEFDERRMELRGLEQPGGGSPRGQLLAGRVTWIRHGGNRCRFLFFRIQSGEADLRIAVTGSGNEIYRGSIALPPAK